MANTAPPVNQKEIFGHPAGLYILFFTELWERFSYYGMRALFTLYLVAETTSDNPGFGWTNTEALELYGWYTMLVYVSSIPGGSTKILNSAAGVIFPKFIATPPINIIS